MEANYKIDTLKNITHEEFYALIDKNRDHIFDAFPITLSGCATLKKTKQFIEQAIDNETWGENYYFYIRYVSSNALIGYVMIKNIEPDIAKCELGYFIDKDFQGKGITSNAVATALAFCFGELKMNKVIICTSLINTASQKIALKHGFSQEGVFRQEFRNGHGKLEDVVCFGLLKSDYKNEE